MGHSLRAKIKCLRYKGIITDKECERIRKALDNENVLDNIEYEINKPYRGLCDYFIVGRIEEIINKYKAESEDQK